MRRKVVAFLFYSLVLIFLPILNVTSQNETIIQPLAQNSLILDMARFQSGRVIAVGERGHVLLSDNNGESWRQVITPVDNMLTAVSVHEQSAWVVGHDATILISKDLGESWSLAYSAPERESPLFDVLFINQEEGVAAGAYGLLLHTTDRGKTWQEVETSEEEPHWYQIAQLRNGLFVLVGEFGSISTAQTMSGPWTKIESPYSGTFFGLMESADNLPSSGDGESAVFIYGLRGHLYQGTLPSGRWEKVNTGDERSLLYAIECGDSLYFAGLSGVLFSYKADQIQSATSPINFISLPDRRALSSLYCLESEKKLLAGGEKGFIQFPLTAFSEQ